MLNLSSIQKLYISVRTSLCFRRKITSTKVWIAGGPVEAVFWRDERIPTV